MILREGMLHASPPWTQSQFDPELLNPIYGLGPIISGLTPNRMIQFLIRNAMELFCRNPRPVSRLNSIEKPAPDSGL